MEITKLDVQGHRGARGLMPENTIPAFLEALKLGVHTLELDLAVTKDDELLVSHEPYMNSEVCLDSTGNEIAKTDELNYNIYQMSYQEIRSFDCGTKRHSRFPQQQKFKVKKPLLRDVVAAVEEFYKTSERHPVNYNIEIKSAPDGDDIYHPTPFHFSDLVYNFLEKNIDFNNVNVQSFDFRVLQYFHEKYPEIRLAALVENQLSIDENLENLGFIPEIYSCDYKLLSKENIDYLHSRGMQVIPWTVNLEGDMETLIEWGIDGIISDYPDKVMTLIKNRE